MAMSTFDPEHGYRWRPWLSAIALVVAVWAVVGAQWLAFPESAPPSAGQSGVLAAVAGLLAAALLRLWDSSDQLRVERRATDASLARLDSALARAQAPPDDPRQDCDFARKPLDQQSPLVERVESLRVDFQRDRQLLRDLKGIDGFGAAWRARFGPSAPGPDQLMDQLDALLGRYSKREP